MRITPATALIAIICAATALAQDSARTRPVPNTAANDATVAERVRRYREAPVEENPTPRASTSPTMRAVHLYSSPTDALEIIVRRGDSVAPLNLFLLDRAGEVLGIAKQVEGRVDLRKTLPGVDGLERAAWLQLAQDETPVGAPLVIQPIREPPPVRVVRELRPQSTVSYTRIVGWGDQPLDPDDTTLDEIRKSWIAGDPPILSGYKVYSEMDVLIRTDHGEILVALAPDEAPNTAWNFRTLVREGFYDRGGFHRIVPADREGRPFVIQGGDPTLTGNGGPGFALALEPSTLAHDYGVISMARADEPHSAGSQFFFVLGREATARLDGQYCSFGYAVSGGRAIDSIAAAPLDDVGEGRPKVVPRILSMQLVPAATRMPGIDRRATRIKPTVPAGESAPATR